MIERGILVDPGVVDEKIELDAVEASTQGRDGRLIADIDACLHRDVERIELLRAAAADSDNRVPPRLQLSA